jgi:CHAD domain-containing protein
MPYRFKLDEKIKKGFRRIAREQVALAVDELSVANIPAAAIHSSRKAIKRLRALLRAAGPALGTAAQRRHDKALRDIARRLSHRRDADVLEETVTKLETVYGKDAIDCLRALRVSLENGLGDASRPLDAESLNAIRIALSDEGKRLSKARLNSRGITAMLDGITATYGDGRRALKRTYNSPSDENVHELRKMVQAHWRHMALLSRAWPEALTIRLEAARELSQVLGDDHDLALLKQAALSHQVEGVDAIIELCERRQAELRDAARPRAARLFAEQPQHFAHRMTVYWQTASGLKSSPKKAKLKSAALDGGVGPEPLAPSESPLDLAAKTLA